MMLVDVELEENNDLEFEIIPNSNISPSVLSKLQNEVNNMGISLKINVQLLSKKNALQFKELFQTLASNLKYLLENNKKEVIEKDLLQMIYNNLYQDLMCENERLFRKEYDIIRETNEILQKRLEFILNHYDYQNSLINMNTLIDHFRVGVHSTNRVIDLQDKIKMLAYQLAVTYKLHSDIKLYMEVQKQIGECKEDCGKVFEYSLNSLQMENLENAIQVRDTLATLLQETKYQEFELLQEEKQIA